MVIHSSQDSFVSLLKKWGCQTCSELSIFKEFYKGSTKWGTSIWEEPRRQHLMHMTDFLKMLLRCTTRHLSERLWCYYFRTHHHHAVETQELETSHSDMGQTPMIRHASLKDCIMLSPRIQAGLFSHSTQGAHTSGHQKETTLKWDWLSAYGGPQVLGALRSRMATLLLHLAWVRFFWNWISYWYLKIRISHIRIRISHIRIHIFRSSWNT